MHNTIDVTYLAASSAYLEAERAFWDTAQLGATSDMLRALDDATIAAKKDLDAALAALVEVAKTPLDYFAAEAEAMAGFADQAHPCLS
jgi:hypothetical protein